MAPVVSSAAVITQEAHRVVLGEMLRVVLDELLGALPQRWDGLLVLEKTKDEAVLLALLGHETERIVVNVAEELDGGLNAPVVLVVEHQFLLEEEARLEATHVTVALRVTVDDLPRAHILAHLLGLLLVDP